MYILFQFQNFKNGSILKKYKSAHAASSTLDPKIKKQLNLHEDGLNVKMYWYCTRMYSVTTSIYSENVQKAEKPIKQYVRNKYSWK
jgi:hypothetical protein